MEADEKFSDNISKPDSCLSPPYSTSMRHFLQQDYGTQKPILSHSPKQKQNDVLLSSTMHEQTMYNHLSRVSCILHICVFYFYWFIASHCICPVECFLSHCFNLAYATKR